MRVDHADHSYLVGGGVRSERRHAYLTFYSPTILTNLRPFYRLTDGGGGAMWCNIDVVVVAGRDAPPHTCPHSTCPHAQRALHGRATRAGHARAPAARRLRGGLYAWRVCLDVVGRIGRSGRSVVVLWTLMAFAFILPGYSPILVVWRPHRLRPHCAGAHFAVSARLPYIGGRHAARPGGGTCNNDIAARCHAVITGRLLVIIVVVGAVGFPLPYPVPRTLPAACHPALR